MLELSIERIDKILHEETPKKEEVTTILRCIYARYMRMYEKCFADMDALDNATIAEFRKTNEETKSLVKYYYLDIPQDICIKLKEFEEKYIDKLLGADWHDYLFKARENFMAEKRGENKSEAELKAEFAKQSLAEFYDAMSLVFRDGFGTGSETVKDVVSGITGLLFGK